MDSLAEAENNIKNIPVNLVNSLINRSNLDDDSQPDTKLFLRCFMALITTAPVELF